MVRLSRSRAETVYPARVQLLLTANPCPCAKPGGDQWCECSPVVRRRYLARLSGPLLDRVDLRVMLQPVRSAALVGAAGGESSAVVAGRVATARAAASARWGTGTNASVPSNVLRGPGFRLPAAVTAPLVNDLDRGLLSARGHDRVIRVAWSMADLDGRARPDAGDIGEALELRRGTPR